MSARDLAIVQPTAAPSGYRAYRFTLRRNGKKPWPELQWRHKEGRVTLRMPKTTLLPDCLAAFERCVPWFDVFSVRGLKQLPGHRLAIDGSMHPVVHSPNLGSATRLDSDVIWVRNLAPARLEKDLFKLVCGRTLSAMRGYVKSKAALLEVEHGNIRLSAAMRKWGACTRKNDLDFSWRLSMAPPFVQEYLAAHEVAHFKHKHHQQSFWEEVDRLMPDWAAAEHWLAFCGSTLMAVDLSTIAPAPPGPQRQARNQAGHQAGRAAHMA